MGDKIFETQGIKLWHHFTDLPEIKLKKKLYKKDIISKEDILFVKIYSIRDRKFKQISSHWRKLYIKELPTKNCQASVNSEGNSTLVK